MSTNDGPAVKNNNKRATGVCVCRGCGRSSESLGKRRPTPYSWEKGVEEEEEKEQDKYSMAMKNNL